MRPAIEAVFTILPPPPCSRNRFAASWMPISTPIALIRMIRSKFSSVISRNGIGAFMPALLNQTSSRPNRSTVAAIAACTVGSGGDVDVHGERRAAVGGDARLRPPPPPRRSGRRARRSRPRPPARGRWRRRCPTRHPSRPPSSTPSVLPCPLLEVLVAGRQRGWSCPGSVSSRSTIERATTNEAIHSTAARCSGCTW